MRSILLHVHQDDCLDARLQVALDLARQFDGHLTCLQAVPYEFGVPGDLQGTIAMEVAAEYRKSAQELKARLTDQLSGEDVEWDLVQSDGRAADLLARHAVLNDLLVLGARNPLGSEDSPSELVSEMVMEVTCPVLVVPADAKRLSLSEVAIVAWNGSAEAARALRAAVPMLARAREVHILAVREKEEEDLTRISTSAAAKYLSRHGIEPEVVELTLEKDHSVSQTLRDAAESRKGAYAVMGAYGHSRLRERLFGGVTRDALSNPSRPLLLGH